MRLLIIRKPLAALAFMVALTLPAAAHAAPMTSGGAPGVAPGATVVTLTFDDGTASQYWALNQLSSHNMNGTFFINSSRIGTSSYYMTWSQIHDLYNAGNEIGGHTADHDNLTTVDPAEAQRQVCDDRANLLNQGFQPTDFAYPFGAYNASTEQMVASCGYDAARADTVAGTQSAPPSDPYAVGISGEANSLAPYETAVTTAEQSGGGWVPLVFHQLCNGCDVDWLSQSDFTTFLDWLQGQEANGVVVETMAQVMGGSVQPAVTIPFPPAPNGWNALRNASLEYNTGSGNLSTTPDCYIADDFGNHTSTWSWTTDSHTGSRAVNVTVSNYSSGDASLHPIQDLGECTPSVTPGHTYVISEWYKSSAPVYFNNFTRDTLGAYSYWQASPTFPASSTWTKATWTTPVIPGGVTGLNFGLSINTNGSMTVDDFAMQDAAPTGSADTTPPTVSLTSPANGATVAGTTTATATASDNVAVDHVDFLIDGAVAYTSTNGLNTYSWYTRNLSNGAHTIAVRAVDTSGNSTTSTPITVYVNNSVTNLLQNPSLESGSGSPSCWQLGGYGTNSATWTYTSDAHTGNEAENLNVTSWTNGDRKLVSAQDTGNCAPAVTPGHSYTVTAWYKVPTGTATPRLFAYYRTPSAGWTYWTISPVYASSSSWTQVTWSTPPVPAGVTNISVGMGLQNVGSVTMDDFGLYDNTPPPDTTPPTSTISCNNNSADNTGCASGWYAAPVQVSLSATDNLGGSGVQEIVYTTDGSDPTLSNGAAYTGPFTVSSTTTVKWRAYDNAGNAEAIHTQLIQIDTVPPTSTIACNDAPCQSGWYGAAVSASLSGADNAAGVAFIRYTTDGTDPSLTNGGDYLGPFSVDSTTTVKWRAYDNAGNAEAINAQLIQIDSVTPATQISCNGGTCSSSWYTGAVSVNLSGSSGGSGVAATYYTTDGSTPTQTTADLYTGPFTVSATTTVKYFSVDSAGNVEGVNSTPIQIDGTPPTSSISCNGMGGCGTGWYNSAVSVGINATDNVGGSGVREIVYTTDGSDPSLSNGLVYTSPLSVASTTTIKYRAYDIAGNAEAVNTQHIQVDSTPPSSNITCNAAACSSSPYSGNVNVDLSAADNSGGSGVAAIYYTTDGSTPTQTAADLYSGTFMITATKTVKYFSVDNAGNAEPVNSQTITVAAAGVTITSPTAGSTVNGTISLGANVGGINVDHVTFIVDGTPVGTATTAPYTVSWDTTKVMDGTHSVVAAVFDSSGVETDSNSVTFSVSNHSGDTTPPTSTISCNSGSCGSSWYTGTVSVSLSATDGAGGSGVASIRYTTDGSDPSLTNGQVYSGAFSVGTTTTVKYRSYDGAGNAEAVNSQLIEVDGVAPSSSISCNSAACSNGFYNAAVSVSLSATDNSGGSGVASIVYTTDGSTPSLTNGTVYTSAFSISSTTTVKYRSYDVAGNAEAVNSVLVQVDTTPPTSQVSCNGTSCGSWFNSASVTLSATDNPGGSGVASIRYTTDGSDPSLTNGQVYSGAFAVRSTTTVKYRAYDNVGNAEPINSQVIRIDAVAPTSTLSCNGANCSASFYTVPVSLTLSATDNSGGSGVASIIYTTDGSTPSPTNGTVYTSAFTVNTSTTIKYRAYDNAGNAEPVNSALIQVDITPPTSQATCNGGSCSGWFKPGVSVSLSAADNPGGSGLASIRYTTDGSTPTTSHGTTYAGALNFSASTTLTYRAYDNVGNAEAPHRLPIQIDGTPPSVSLTSPNAGYAFGTLNLSATASDNVAVDHVDFLVDGNVVGTATTAPYTFAWNSATVPDGSHTISARAVDPAGNATTTPTVTVTLLNHNLVQNPSLETAASNGTPTCWQLAGYGTNSVTWTHTTDAHTGSFGENLNMTAWTNGDRKLMPLMDTGSCAPAVNAGHTYTATAWYKVTSGTTSPRFFAYYYLPGTGWTYWTGSPTYAVTGTWTQVTWTTPAIPTGATLLSVGLGLQNVGSLTMDDFGLFPTG